MKRSCTLETILQFKDGGLSLGTNARLSAENPIMQQRGFTCRKILHERRAGTSTNAVDLSTALQEQYIVVLQL
jgi:hypothetical protein